MLRNVETEAARGARQIAVPVGHILVGDTRCDVEHDDGALALDAARGNGQGAARNGERRSGMRLRAGEMRWEHGTERVVRWRQRYVGGG
eukprot:6203417-Pleurochrysis_carterae.AAC.1